MEAGRYHEREHWLALAPGLHIEDRSLFEAVTFLELPPAAPSRFGRDGYVQGSADWGLDVDLMAGTVRALSAADVSPLFAFLYDEFWLPFFKLHLLHGALLGGRYALLPDFWILDVDPKKGGAGWRPHRDKGRRALFDDGSPKSVTTWIPLSTATPLNGCLYVVPAQHDPTYATADEAEMRFEHQSIRALPAGPGDFVIWNQAIYHWGGKTSPQAAESRVSMAFQFQRADLPAFNDPLIEPLQVLPFETRMRLIARQLYRYRHLYELDPKLAQLASEPIGETVREPALLPEAGASMVLSEPAPMAPAPIAPAPMAPTAPAPAAPALGLASDPPASAGKVGRNQPCPCGSGKKYKQCHGALR